MGLADQKDLWCRVRAWRGAETSRYLYYALFSRSGFMQVLRMRDDDDPALLLFGPEDVA